jgi:hypothetical protein
MYLIFDTETTGLPKVGLRQLQIPTTGLVVCKLLGGYMTKWNQFYQDYLIQARRV